MSEFLQQLEELRPYLTQLRRTLHAHPELGHQEQQTAARIEAELDAAHIPHRRCGGTGVVGILRGTAAAPAAAAAVVALRADIDALPIEEQNDVPYRSQEAGRMHACGHDAHTACLLGAARLLAAHTAAFSGEIRMIFQPAEEIGSGTRPFLEAGVMQGVDRAFGLHVAPDLPAGKVGLKPGLNNASVDHFTVRVQGKAAHVSTPQLGADALYIACQTVVALQALVTRCTSPVEPVIIGVGKLQAGDAYNAVAERAVLEGTTRAVTHETRAHLREQVTEAARQTAALYGGTAEVEWEDFSPPLINDAQATAEAVDMVRALWGDGRVIPDRALSLGGDNFADFQLAAPGVYAYLGSANPALPATQNALHNGGFELDEAVLPFGAGLYAASALWWLTGGAAWG